MNRAAAALAKRVPEIAELESMQVHPAACICAASLPGRMRTSHLQTGRAIREMRAQLGRLPEWFEYFAALIRVEEGLFVFAA